MKLLKFLFEEEYLEWNEYLDAVKERCFFADKHLIKQRGWDYVL